MAKVYKDINPEKNNLATWFSQIQTTYTKTAFCSCHPGVVYCKDSTKDKLPSNEASSWKGAVG